MVMPKSIILKRFLTYLQENKIISLMKELQVNMSIAEFLTYSDQNLEYLMSASSSYVFVLYYYGLKNNISKEIINKVESILNTSEIIIPALQYILLLHSISNKNITILELICKAKGEAQGREAYFIARDTNVLDYPELAIRLVEIVANTDKWYQGEYACEVACESKALAHPELVIKLVENNC